MGKCIASGRIPQDITVCSSCLHKSVCGDKDYLSQNHCCNFADAEEIASLRSQLAETQRERDAAVADMKAIVDKVREEHSGETCCFACAYDGDTSITDSGAYANECPGFERDDCFKWRGKEPDNAEN